MLSEFFGATKYQVKLKSSESFIYIKLCLCLPESNLITHLESSKTISVKISLHMTQMKTRGL